MHYYWIDITPTIDDIILRSEILFYISVYMHNIQCTNTEIRISNLFSLTFKIVH